jgi:tetratricopeptide (TPR) repeat protein
LEEIDAEAGARGALVVWGRCLEGNGTPSMWPWVQLVGAVLDDLPASAQDEWRGSELGTLVEPRSGALNTPVLPDAGAQFRLFEQIAALIRHASAHRPVVVVTDDLQWADVASLQMFGHLATRPPDRTLLIGALRDGVRAPGSELARTLAAASRVPRHRRVRLGALDAAEVTELVRREWGLAPSPAVAHSILARTSGNPFFVRELARFLAEGEASTEDAAALAGVPPTVRDIVLDRMAELDDDAIGLLQTAALVGRDINLRLLARAAFLEVETCIERLEALELLGLIEAPPAHPHSFRFAHDLVRESVVHSTPLSRAARLHLNIADSLEYFEGSVESGAERLAHHLWAAGPLADSARTAGALVRAGRRAAAKSAFESAAGQLVKATEVARAEGLPELELSALSQLTAVIGVQSGYVGSAVDLLERAEELARGLGRAREAADFLFSRWAGNSQSIQLDQSGPLAHRLLEQGEESADPVVRAYGRHAWGIHQWDVGNIGEAVRYLIQSDVMVDDPARREDEPLRHDLQLLSPVMLALNLALHGDVEQSRTLFDRVETGADDDAYAVTVWAAFAVTAAALVGDPVWALRAAERGIAADPEHKFIFLGAYPRLARCWAQAVTGQNASDAAAEARGIIDAALLEPARSGLATWYGLLGEMFLAAGMLPEATAALDRAETSLATFGQRYAEGLILLLRARLMQACGEPPAPVKIAAEKARGLSIERGAYLFARRAEDLLASLSTAAAGR